MGDSFTSPVRKSNSEKKSHEKCMAPKKGRNQTSPPRRRPPSVVPFPNLDQAAAVDSNYTLCAVETCKQQFLNWLNLDGSPRHNMCENCIYKYYMVDKNEYDNTNRYY